MYILRISSREEKMPVIMLMLMMLLLLMMMTMKITHSYIAVLWDLTPY